MAQFNSYDCPRNYQVMAQFTSYDCPRNSFKLQGIEIIAKITPGSDLWYGSVRIRTSIDYAWLTRQYDKIFLRE